MDRGVGEGPRVAERRRGVAARVGAARGDRELHLDRRQQLSDLVVQLARDRAALLFLRGEELRREPLQVARVLRVLDQLTADLRLEAPGVDRRSQRDREAGGERETE